MEQWCPLLLPKLRRYTHECKHIRFRSVQNNKSYRTSCLLATQKRNLKTVLYGVLDKPSLYVVDAKYTRYKYTRKRPQNSIFFDQKSHSYHQPFTPFAWYGTLRFSFFWKSTFGHKRKPLCWRWCHSKCDDRQMT